MTLLSKVGSSLASLLPQNQHVQKAKELGKEIQSLTHSLTDKTGPVFKGKVTETTTLIQTEKSKCIDDLFRMNGAYYQDPKSTLKKAWDRVATTVHTALGIRTERRDQLTDISVQLKAAPPTKEMKTAERAITSYTNIEKKRDLRQEQLNKIVSTEKGSEKKDEEFVKRKQLLQEKRRKLCGDYFGDKNGELDKAWTKYQTAIANSSSGVDELANYTQLEEYRKCVEAELFNIDQQLSLLASKDRTYETLTTDSIQKQIAVLRNRHMSESNLSGIDWKGLATSTAKVALATAGFILIS
jgi:hypothetical protein